MRTLVAPALTLLRYGLALCCATLMAFALLIVLALGTESGRLQLSQIALTQLNRAADLQIHIDNLRLPSLAEWQLDKLVLERDGQVALQIENLSLEWRPLALFRQQLIVEQLQIGKLDVDFRVSEQPATTAAPLSALSMPVALQYIAVQHLSVGRLEAAAAPATRLSGELQWQAGEPLQLGLNASTLEPYLGHPLSVSAGFEVAEDFTLVQLEYLDLLIDDQRAQHISGFLQAGKLDFTVSLLHFPLDLLARLPLVQSAHPAIAELFSQGLNQPHPQNQISARATIGGSLAEPTVSAEINLQGQYKQSPLALHMVAQGSADDLQIDRFEGQLLGANLSAQGALSSDGSAELSLRVEHLLLSRLRALGVPLGDDLDGEIMLVEGLLQGPLSNPLGELQFVSRGSYQQQPLSLKGRLRKTPNRIHVDRLQLTTDLGRAALQGAIELDTLTADLQLNLIDASVTLLGLADVELPSSLSAQINGELSLRGRLNDANVSGELRAAGRYLEMPFTLLAKGTSDGQQSHFESLQLGLFDKPSLELKGDYSAAQFDLSLQLYQLPTELFHMAGWELPEGQFEGQLRLSGSQLRPQLNGDLQFSAQRPVLDDQGEELLANWLWQLQLSTEHESLNLISKFQRNNSAPGQLVVALPLQPYIAYLAKPRGAADLPLAVSLKGMLDLQALSFLIDQDIQRLQGTVSSDLTIGGTLAEPQIEGYLEVADGSYVNHLSGTELRDIACRLVTAPAVNPHIRLVVERCGGGDGRSGDYALSGDIELPAPSHSSHPGAINLRLQSQRANFIRRSDIEAEVSGDLSLQGDFKKLRLSGALDLSPFTAVLGDSFASSAPALVVEEVFAPSGQPQPTAAVQFALPALSVDLVISASQQAYLRGRGLEAELRGQIALKGDAEALQYEGQFNTVRGVFELFGKQFKLQKGQVSFTNNSIVMDISGSYKKAAQQIDVRISGAQDDIDISLTAVPPLPEDEIIAFIIFGKTLDRISPIEALQLAAAVQTLRSGSSQSFDPIGSTRQLLGVDTLNIGSSAGANGETGLNLGVGKYLNEKVYLEVERTPNPSQPWKGNITIELAPNITLESSTGGEAGVDSAQLRWKRDY